MASVKCASSDKLGPRSDKCKFMGYPKETVGNYFYNPAEQKVFVLKHVTFLEKEFLLERISRSKIVFEKVQEPQAYIPIEPEPMVEALDT